MLTNASQLIQRNLDRFSEIENLLLISPPGDGVNRILPETTQFLLTDCVAAEQLKNTVSDKTKVHYDTHLTKEGAGCTFNAVIIYMPKSKEELRMKLHNGAALLSPEGDIFVVGSKKEGTASANKVMLELGGKPLKVDSARHCVLWCFKPTKQVNFQLADWESVFDVDVADEQIKVCTLPGVFAHQKLDIGTRFLLETLHNVQSSQQTDEFNGLWLDFACGAGIIAAHFKKKYPEMTVEGTDCSTLAVHCSHRTMSLNKSKGVFYLGDGLKQITTKKYNGIITNPPFHTGVKTDYSIAESFIVDAKKHLKKQGRLYMVANNFLDYEQRLKKVFGNVEVLASNGKFNIYVSRN